MKKLTIRTEKIDEKNTFEVSIDDSYYEFLHTKLKQLTNKSTGIIETKSLISALISSLIEEQNLKAQIDKLYDECFINKT